MEPSTLAEAKAGAGSSLFSILSLFLLVFSLYLTPGYSPVFFWLLLGEHQEGGKAPAPEWSGGAHLAPHLSLPDWKTRLGEKAFNLQTGAQKVLPGGPAELAHSSCGLSANGELKITNPAGVPHFHLSPSLVLPPTPSLHAALSVENQQG